MVEIQGLKLQSNLAYPGVEVTGNLVYQAGVKRHFCIASFHGRPGKKANFVHMVTFIGNGCQKALCYYAGSETEDYR